MLTPRRFWLTLGVFSCFTVLETYNISSGGTKLRRMPQPYMVVITQTDHWADSPQPDCVGVYIGGFGKPDRAFLLTAPLCVAPVEPNGTFRELQEVRNAVNEITTAEPFQLPSSPDDFQIAALELFIPVGYWVPEIANMIESKNEFKRYLDAGSDSHTYGFAMAVNTNPIKVFVVSWNQETCIQKYKQLKLPGWPEDIRDGGFCVFNGKHQASNVTIEKHVYNIDVGVPCDDAMGSPVLTSDFNKVLGIILSTYCEGKESVAFAISSAYLPDISPKTTTSPSTTSTSQRPSVPVPPPPPYPRIPEPLMTCSTFRIFSHIPILSVIALPAIYLT